MDRVQARPSAVFYRPCHRREARVGIDYFNEQSSFLSTPAAYHLPQTETSFFCPETAENRPFRRRQAIQDPSQRAPRPKLTPQHLVPTRLRQSLVHLAALCSRLVVGRHLELFRGRASPP